MAEVVHPVDLHVGRRLRERRIAEGVSQADLGDALGISAQQVQKYENGANRISASRLFEVAGRLGAGIDWFFEGLGTGGVARLAEPAAAFEPAPSRHDETRELIAIYRTLPDDKARHQLLSFAQKLRDGI